MEHFSEEAPTYEEAVEQVRQKYGDRAKIYARERRTTRGFLGFGRKETVLVSGYVTAAPAQPEPPPVQQEQGYDQLLSELKRMEQRLASRNQGASAPVRSKQIEKMEALLDGNDFSRDFISNALQLVQSRLSVKDLEDPMKAEMFILRLISETFRFDVERALSLPRVFGIVGPTGVGKTTTVAKIAARFSLSPSVKRRRRVKIITIDSFRIGAREQIGNYGSLMDIPVDSVETPQQLARCMEASSDADLLLIDTIGKSPRDTVTLQEMQKFLSVCGEDVFWALALSASTKARDMMTITETFEPFKYQSLILTKLDETDYIGNIVSMLHERQKPILYVSAGQKVPTDLLVPKTELFLEKLQGFSVDLEHLTTSG